MKNPSTDNKSKVLSENFGVSFSELQITLLLSLRNYVDQEEMTMVYLFLA